MTPHEIRAMRARAELLLQESKTGDWAPHYAADPKSDPEQVAKDVLTLLGELRNQRRDMFETIIALLLSGGGTVAVSQRTMLDAMDDDMVVQYGIEPATGAKVFTALKRPTRPRPELSPDL